MNSHILILLLYQKVSNVYVSDLDDKSSQDPPRLLPSFVCSNCPGIFTNKSDLLMHSQLKHSQQAAYLCGLCTQQCTSLANLKSHLEYCSRKQKITHRFLCQVCKYGDDNLKSLENHVRVHEFLIDDCRKQLKIFDPANYVEINENYELGTTTKNLTCVDCGLSDFESLNHFSNHRRSQHSVYHCDLCNKSYGRNSHLWKHVNRLHKGHPSITCQICCKTSASKYHLLQHFNKTHLAKGGKQKINTDISNILLTGKYQSPVAQTSMVNCNAVVSNEYDEDEAELVDISSIKKETEEVTDAPKEIDPSHFLYNNIITNYTPPPNEGEYKCQKCSKGFHKKSLLKKHNRNCRPKLQKDLLTRCKSCSRVFKDRQSLAKHLVNYHSDYACEICHQNVQSKCEIITHIRFQHPDSNLMCELCKNVLRSSNDMKEHLENHQESHICQFCGDDLSNKIKLKMHILSLHRKILSLSCGICLKLFENQQVLKDHVTLLHKDQLVLHTSCPVCGKKYGSKWKTYDHINKSHGKVFKACRTCLEVFNSDAHLQAHCDVTSHGPSSGFNTSALRSTIMALVKGVVEQTTENNNENVDFEQETKMKYSDEGQDMMLLEKGLNGKRLAEDDIEQTNKKIKTDLIPDQTSEVKFSPVNSSKRTVYINGNDPACCEICFKSWPAKKHLWQHYIRCHKIAAATVCGICLKTNDTYEMLQTHLQENHPKLLHGQGIGSNFICKICGRYHNASSKLRLHMGIHTNLNWDMFENKPLFLKEEISQDILKYESLIEKVECSSSSESEGELINKFNLECETFSDEYIDNVSSSIFSSDEDEEQ